MAVHHRATIHASAVVEDGAEIAPGCFVGPFCIVGAQARLHTGVTLKSHVVIEGDTEIGSNTTIWPFASIGSQPQDLKYAGEKTRLKIGKRNMIRESVSINPGTKGGGGLTIVGDDCLFMLGAHVGHDCKIGNKVVIANHGSIAGHAEIGDNVIIGGLVGVHQYCRIGQGAIIGALSIVVADVIPYGSVLTGRSWLAGLNLVGLKRSGLARDEIHLVRRAYRALFDGSESLKTGAENLQAAPEHPIITQIAGFVLQDSNRSFLTPKTKQRNDDR